MASSTASASALALASTPLPVPTPLPFRTPWEIQRSVIYALFIRELKTRLGGKWLGAFWAFGEPLAHVLFMMFMLETVRGRVMANVDFSVFLVTGVIPFVLFKNLSMRLMGAVEANRGLFGYRQVKPMDAFLSRALLEIVISATVFVMALGLLEWWGIDALPVRPLEMLGIVLLLIASGFGTGLTLAMATHSLPASRTVVKMLFWPLYFISGVIFSVNTLPDEVVSWLLWNPILHALELLRSNYMNAYRPIEEISLGLLAGFAGAVMLTGWTLYWMRRDRLLT